MNHARSDHGIALFAGRILVVAGYGCDSVEMLTPPRAVGDLGQWTDLNPIGVATAIHWARLSVH